MSQSLSPPRNPLQLTVASQLSNRQSDCLKLAAEGLSSRQIGERLNLSARTVDDHILLGCRTLGVRTRVQAVAVLMRDDRREAEPRSFAP